MLQWETTTPNHALKACGDQCQRESHPDNLGRFQEQFRRLGETRTCVIVKSRIFHSPEAIKNRHQPRVFLVDPRPRKIGHRNTMTRLAASTKAIAEHETERGHPHPALRLSLVEASSHSERQNDGDCSRIRIGGFPVFITRRVAINGVRAQAPS